MSQEHKHKRRSTQGRPAKPAPQRRSLNHNHAGQSSNGKLGSSSKKKSSTDLANSSEDVEQSGMAGLPQFCTTCEKQIVTPGNSILYCSEFCRKKDTSRPLSIQLPNIQSAASYFDNPEPSIVPQRSPTIARPASLIFSDFSTSGPASPTEESDGNGSSEAARYLSQFHSQSYTEERPRPRRPRANRYSSATDGIPSLSHTPSSSVGTMPSKSVELVMPSYRNYFYSSSVKDASVESSTSTITPGSLIQEGNKSYPKQDISLDEQNSTGGGLKQLFNHDDMQTNPTEAGGRRSEWAYDDTWQQSAISGL